MTQELLLTIAGAITASGIIIGALIAIFKLARRISDAIGVNRDGRTISERLDRVEHQLWENGGSSLADRVNVIGEHTIKTMAKLELIEDLLLSNRINNQQEAPKKTRMKKVS